VGHRQWFALTSKIGGKMKKLSPAVIYRKTTTGEAISDEEIAFGIEHFGKLAEMLMDSGVAFSITAAECNRVTEFLKRCMRERNL
jgi:hypothetical protein